MCWAIVDWRLGEGPVESPGTTRRLHKTASSYKLIVSEIRSQSVLGLSDSIFHITIVQQQTKFQVNFIFPVTHTTKGALRKVDFCSMPPLGVEKDRDSAAAISPLQW